MLIASSFAMAEKTNARLHITDFFAYAPFAYPDTDFIYLGFDNSYPVNGSYSVNGFLNDASNNGISNRDILIYVNNILMGKTNTDSNGCFYFNSWNKTKLKPLLDEAKTKGKGTIPVKIRAIFHGDNTYKGSMGYRKNSILLGPPISSYAMAPPSKPPFLIQPNGSFPLAVSVRAGGSADLPLSVTPEVRAKNITLQFVGVPCGVQVSVIPSMVYLKQTLYAEPSSLVVHITADSHTKTGDYTLGIKVNNAIETSAGKIWSSTPVLQTIHLTIHCPLNYKPIEC